MVNVSTLSQSLSQISRLKTQQAQLGDLALQISSGKKTEKLSGLGTDILKSTRARVGTNSLNTYIDNITNAQRRMKLMDTSVTKIREQAENISNSLTIAVQEGDYPDLESIKKLAGNVKNFMLSAMNAKDGDRYLFGGADSSAPPISDTGMFKSFAGEFVPDESDLTNPPLISSGLVGNWGDGTITTDEFIASYHATTDVVMGYSNAVVSGTTGKMTVRVDENAEFDYTTLANDPAMRDIMMVLNMIEAMPPVEYVPGALNDPMATTIAEDTYPYPSTEKQENFYKVLNDLAGTLNKAVDKIDNITYQLSHVQAQTSIIKEIHTSTKATFADIIGEVEDIDVTEASAKILQVQTQLEVSYQVTALISQLSLSNFL